MAGGLLAAPLVVEAQQPARVAVIGVLNPGSVDPGSPMLPAFRQGLRELGWVENDVGPEPHELGSKAGEAFGLPVRKPLLEADVLALSFSC